MNELITFVVFVGDEDYFGVYLRPITICKVVHWGATIAESNSEMICQHFCNHPNMTGLSHHARALSPSCHAPGFFRAFKSLLMRQLSMTSSRWLAPTHSILPTLLKAHGLYQARTTTQAVLRRESWTV